ncbi:MAG: hypothetical protein EA339_05220 [Rhodobacteraceae bacterium]|nr:MAG: hypothetical protein EA339_05220 [Paracoccaceae bacterium]
MNATLKAAALALIAATPLHAQNFGDGQMGLGVGLSTLGVTGDLSYQLDPTLTVRMLAGAASISRSGTLDEDDTTADYRATLRIGGIGPVVDYHPFENGWRLSGGALLSNYRANARFTGEIEIDGTEYEDADVRARLRTRNSVMPKLAVGYSGANLFGSSLGLSFDAGVLYTGGFRTTITDRSADAIPEADLTTLRRDIDDAIGNVRFLPYVSAGLRMNF